MSGVTRSRIDAWFNDNDWQVFDYQSDAWEAFGQGQSGLIHSPTGSGKTLAAWLGPLQHISTSARGLRVLWITPLRALANDTHENLQAAVTALGSDWRVGIRTGDTSSSEKARQRRTPPQALITTPESLSVLLSYADADNWFGSLDAVVVDEWHELLGSKRGVQLELCLARLRALRSDVVTWGLSATLANLEEAMTVLCGETHRASLIAGASPKQIDIASVLPESLERFPQAGPLGLALVEPVVEQIHNAVSTLVFTNTRSQAESWFDALLRARPDWLGRIALHHGSIDRKIRQTIEQGLRDGALLAVICTSSLDLGVDFAPVDQVLQIGSPKGVARLMQRAGRSGHQPGAVSTVQCVPTHALELVEIVAAREAWHAGRIEPRVPLTRSLDVLVQHLVTRALGGGFESDGMLAEVRTTHAFSALSDTAWQWCLDFITRGGQALAGYPQFNRVSVVDGLYRMTDQRLSRQHRMSIGTIASDTAMRVKWISGGSLGTIEESFVSRLDKGDRFLFAGRLVELVQIRDMTAYVRKSKRVSKTVPRWQGGRMPLSTALADSMLAVLSAYADKSLDAPELEVVRSLLDHQIAVSRLPAPGRLLVERCQSREGHSLFLFPFAGRLVHEGMATLLAMRISREQPITFTLSANDYGIELLSADALDCDTATLRTWLSVERLVDDMYSAVNLGETAKRQFRDIARIAGLVFSGYPGSGKSTRQIQASSGLIFDVLMRYDEDNLLLDQSRREVLDAQLEVTRMRAALVRLQDCEVDIVDTQRLSPFAFPLWAERLQSQIMSSETWKARVQRMADQLNRRTRKKQQRAGRS
ncbi:MAG: ligase-associated DNA damage response DEXH box helicase [Pseudomonadota bacterium]